MYSGAMLELGLCPHRLGDMATCLKRDVAFLVPTRHALEGMTWGPNHEDTAFTVPLRPIRASKHASAEWRS
jgi:hypothetical protein